MKINGKEIAAQLFVTLQNQVALLKKNHIIPHLAIILVGDNPASISYVKRKQIKAEEIGAKATIFTYEATINNKELLEKIEELNKDKTIHGIIIQRPLPTHIDTQAINQAVIPQKDIDAFHKSTPFEMPLAKAVMLLLEDVYTQKAEKETFTNWLKEKKITVIGKGETGGGPIISLLKKHTVLPTVIDSKTVNPQEILETSDIVISAVGKEKVITKDMLKKGVILISVGQHKQSDGKFHGDYEQEDIEEIASFYSPTPGGVGPVNVACLLENLLLAAKSQMSK
jgi:methylenetetrahydrofolate dehydrogenase (NADP+)/methenyltetrahydrofolate cyclohydrolase